MTTSLLERSIVKRVSFEFKIANYEQIRTDFWTSQITNTNKDLEYISSKQYELGNDLLANVKFYPIGDQNSKLENTALFVYIINNNATDIEEENTLTSNETKKTFKIYFTTGTMGMDFSMTEEQRKTFKDGYGFTNFVSQKYFQKNPKIEVQIEMELQMNANFNVEKRAFKQQLHGLYINCMADGDIDIIVKDVESKANEMLQPPPIKKRKLRQSKRIENRNKKNKNENESKIEEIGNISSLKMSGLMLKSCSPMFAAMLDTNHSMLEQQTKTIVIYSDFEEDVYDMFYFICTNKLKISANAARILALAHYYQLDSLINVCSGRLLDELCVETFVDVVKIFDKYEIRVDYQRLPEFAKTHASDIKCRPEFNDLPHYFRMCCDSCSRFGNNNSN